MYREPKVKEIWLGLGDIHSGSEIAPIPDEVSVDLLVGGHRTILPNPNQVLINECWKDMLSNLPRLTGVIVNGDSCDGTNRKGAGKGNWTTDLKAQVLACADLLKPIKRRLKAPSNIYFTLGSEYHVVDDRPLDQAVCDELGGHYQAEQVIPMLQGDFRVQVHHVISGSLGNWTYLPTAPARDHMLVALQNADKEYGNIKWVIRSHRHYYTDGRFGAHRGFTILPGWQGKTEYNVRKGHLVVPKLGYCLLKLYDDGSANMVPFLTRVLKPCQDAEVEYVLD
jgi:hypothetical protein